MKNRTAYLIIGALIYSLTAFGQSQEVSISSSKSSETRVDLHRTITLEKDSKPEEVIISIKQKTQTFALSITSSVTIGKLTIDVYDPNDKKEGNFTVGTQLNSEKTEKVNGLIRIRLNEPQTGDWKVKIIPSNATGNVKIEASLVE